MTEERTRGVLLYATAAIVLLGGGVWWFRAAPDTGTDPRLAAWQAAVEEALPDIPLQADADTVVLDSSLSTDRTRPVSGGSYSLVMVCAGTGHVRVRVSTNRRDSGRAVQCADKPQPERLNVALADEFFISVAAEDDKAGSVFRWRLERNVGY